MIRLKYISLLSGHCSLVWLRCLLCGVFVLSTVSVAWGGHVTHESARHAAWGQVRHHIAVIGDWNGTVSPTIGDPEIIVLKGGRSAYLFPVHPTGYVIVSAYDNLCPTPFYSSRSTFDITRIDNPNALESWILYRLNVKAAAAEGSQISKASGAEARSSRVSDAWSYFDRLSAGQADQAIARNAMGSAADTSGEIIKGAVVAPLLATTWGQDSPYNIVMPDDGCAGEHTLSGCVATAWAQVLNYWQWPPQSGGEGAHTYTWEGATVTTDLSVDFTNPEAYDWTNMPGNLNASGTTQAQKEAVSKLMYYVAVAAEMDFGCPESTQGSGSTRWADEILDTYFRYKPLDSANNRIDVSDYTSVQWFSTIKTELDADPPRPIIFSMGSQIGWHEVVIDGYQEGVADKVHINFGWEGNHDAYFDITDDDDFNAGGFDWAVDEEQTMVIGIEPDNSPPLVQAGDDADAEESANVTLSVVSALDPEGIGISHYQWIQISGPTAVINNSTSTTPTITTPNVHATTELVFQVKAYDMNHAFGTDNCTINVNNTDGSADPNASSSSGGGCYINNLING